ncbi:transcription factor HES-2-like [Betta splendens]|uniref:Transcription factor HES-2-like n=1 Tax=Betta splendens TaxID=158456 RepID=A0A6P7KSX0_BETSP|nr:transcription factor HES-2-like [Betta splendens]
MKLLQDSSDVKSTSKILKPQVERRRRERMNRSLDRLKGLLLQPQEQVQRRVEKTEILERTVVFLQNSGREDKVRAAGQGQSFRDGFSSCLQRASLFLGAAGTGLWLQGALDASLTARFVGSESAEEHKETDALARSLRLRRSSRAVLQMLIRTSGYRLRTHALNGANCVEPSRSRPTSQQTHRVTGRGNKQSPPRMSLPVGQSLWRPWP